MKTIELYAIELAAYKAAQGKGWQGQLMADWANDHARQRGALRSCRNDPRFKDYAEVFAQFAAWEAGYESQGVQDARALVKHWAHYIAMHGPRHQPDLDAAQEKLAGLLTAR